MEASAIYGLEYQSRALCSNAGESESIRFFAGTLSPKIETESQGQVHQIDFNDETNKISRKIYKPKIGEIWQIQCSPFASNRLAICYNQITESSTQMKASVFELPEENSEKQELKLKGKLEDTGDSGDSSHSSDNILCLDWHPSKENILATVTEHNFVIWNTENYKVVSNFKNTSSNVNAGGKWNPGIEGNQFATYSKDEIVGVDIRSLKESWKIPKAHKFQIRDLDFNPNKQYFMATCGDDCTLKIWDFRKPKTCLKSLECHSHWIWKVRYNSVHDQLLLTSGSDFRVILHSIPSLSSEPRGRTIFSDNEEEIEKESSIPRLEEGILAKYEEHEDAVYAVEWSNYDPWIFASLSYDGRLVINKVPKSQKYKILL